MDFKALFNTYFKVSKRMCLGLVLLSFFYFIVGNGQYTLFNNSEPHYARVAQELWQGSDWLTMPFNGDAWFVHPPLHFWMMSILGPLFSWSEFILRLPEGVFSGLILWITYLFGRLMFSHRVGLISALVLGSSFYFTVLGRLGIFDAQFNFFIFLAMYLFFVIEKDPSARRIGMMGMGVSMALAVLFKGPFGCVQPMMGILPYLLWKRRLKAYFNRDTLLGVAVFFLLVAPWYIHQLATHGKPFFDLALRDYTWYRFFGVVEGQSGSKWYYLPVLLAFFPWVVYFPALIKTFFARLRAKDLFTQSSRDFWVFSMGFTVITLLFFTASGTKLPNYIYMIFPFLSILLAQYFCMESPIWLKRSTIVLPVVLGIGVIWAQGFVSDVLMAEHEWLIVAFFLILFNISTLYFFVMQRRGPQSAVWVYAGGYVFFVMFLVFRFFPTAEFYKPERDIVHYFSTVDAPYVVVEYNAFNPYLMFYLNHNLYDINSFDEVVEMGKVHAGKDVYLLFRSGKGMDVPDGAMALVLATPELSLTRLTRD